MPTGKEEQISAMAMPTNQVKKETTTQPQTKLAGPAYSRLEPYNGVIPVNRVIVENDIARVLNRVCLHTKRKEIVRLKFTDQERGQKDDSDHFSSELLIVAQFIETLLSRIHCYCCCCCFFFSSLSHIEEERENISLSLEFEQHLISSC